MRAGLKPAPTDGSPNNYELRIMHNGFSQWMDFPNNYELSLCTMDFPMDGLPQQLRIMHYAQWISQWMDLPTITNYTLCTMDFPNGWITPTITNYALCIMNYIVVGFDEKKEGVSRLENPF